MQNGIRPRDPVHTGRLHCQGGDGALLKPEDPLLQVGGEGIESAHRVDIKLVENGYIALAGAHIGTGGMGIDHGLHPLNPQAVRAKFTTRPDSRNGHHVGTRARPKPMHQGGGGCRLATYGPRLGHLCPISCCLCVISCLNPGSSAVCRRKRRVTPYNP